MGLEYSKIQSLIRRKGMVTEWLKDGIYLWECREMAMELSREWGFRQDYRRSGEWYNRARSFETSSRRMFDYAISSGKLFI